MEFDQPIIHEFRGIVVKHSNVCDSNVMKFLEKNCGTKSSGKPSDPSPLTPYDIVLVSNEHRVFFDKNRGESMCTINKEDVFYHPKKDVFS